MMSLVEIEYQSRRAARRSRTLGLEPFVITDAHKAAGDWQPVCKKIPSLGDRCPKGWRRVDPQEWFDESYTRGVYGYTRGVYKAGFFVQSSVGADNEPALTPAQFFDLAKPGYGYAIVEVGQFQLHIGVFEPTGAKRVDPNKAVKAAQLERDKLAEKIERLVAKLDKRIPLPAPGDCFFCQGMVTNISSGEKTPASASSCLHGHVEEGYLHGSLVRNAMRWADEPLINVESVKNALRRYLRAHLGFEEASQ